MIAGGDMARGSRQWEMLSVSFVRGMGVVGFGANDAWMGGGHDKCFWCCPALCLATSFRAILDPFGRSRPVTSAPLLEDAKDRIGAGAAGRACCARLLRLAVGPSRMPHRPAPEIAQPGAYTATVQTPTIQPSNHLAPLEPPTTSAWLPSFPRRASTSQPPGVSGGLHGAISSPLSPIPSLSGEWPNCWQCRNAVRRRATGVLVSCESTVGV